MFLKQEAKRLIKKNSSLTQLVNDIIFNFKHHQNISGTTEYEKKIITEIQKKGYYIIPDFASKDFCEKCIADIENILENHKNIVQENSDLRIFGAEELSESIRQFSDDKFLNYFANHYNCIETKCAFTLANKIEFDEKSKKLGSGGGWHRDSVNRQCKAILYLTDVNKKNGVYQMITRSHKLIQKLNDIKIGSLSSAQTRFSDEQINKIVEQNPERLETITGNAGTLILKECSAIHRGSPLKEGKRYALTNYWFFKSQITPEMVKQFSPVVSPEKVLAKGK